MPKNFLIRLALTLSVLLLWAGIARAAVTYTVVTDTIGTDYSPTGSSGQIFASSNGAGTPLPPFTADFNGQTEFILRLEAPAGKKIVVTPEPNFTFLQYSVYLQDGLGGLSDSLQSLVFENLEGVQPESSHGTLTTGSTAGSGIVVDGTGVLFLTPFSFTAAVMTFPVPAGSAGIFVDRQLGGSIAIYADFEIGGADPGLWVTFADVPEPASAALLVLMGAALVGRRR